MPERPTLVDGRRVTPDCPSWASSFDSPRSLLDNRSSLPAAVPIVWQRWIAGWKSSLPSGCSVGDTRGGLQLLLISFMGVDDFVLLVVAGDRTSRGGGALDERFPSPACGDTLQQGLMWREPNEHTLIHWSTRSIFL